MGISINIKISAIIDFYEFYDRDSKFYLNKYYISIVKWNKNGRKSILINNVL